MTPTSESTLNPDHRNHHLSRRRALQGAASVAGLALPAGVALTIEASKLQAAAGPADLPGDVDPHIGWWAERQKAKAEVDAADALQESLEGDYEDAEDDRLYAEAQDRLDDSARQQWDIEEKIAQTPAATPEGLAIVATVLLLWQADVNYPEIDQRAGATLARYILDQTPADVLRSAGLEVAA